MAELDNHVQTAQEGDAFAAQLKPWNKFACIESVHWWTIEAPEREGATAPAKFHNLNFHAHSPLYLHTKHHIN